MNNDKVLLVTGASSDIGLALINSIYNNYDKIICQYRSSTALIEQLQARVGDRIMPIYADFSDINSTENFINGVKKNCPSPTHFVHLSSSNSRSINVKFAKTDWLQFEEELNITFRSAVMCCQAFLPAMAKTNHGKIVIMLSSHIVWEPAKAFSTAYTCVKHALYGLMKSLSAEYISKGVTINAISPSMIDTKFLLIPDFVKELNIEKSPLKRLLTVDDIVPTIEFLLSSGADTITGENIAITGGC